MKKNIFFIMILGVATATPTTHAGIFGFLKSLFTKTTQQNQTQNFNPATQPVQPVNPAVPQISIEDAWSKDKNPAEVIVTREGIDVRRKHLQTLKPGTWLTATIIDVYIELLKKYTNNTRIYYFDTGFYEKIRNDYAHGKSPVINKPYIKKSPDDIDMILIPCNIHETHWVVIVINMKEKKFESYDSLNHNGNAIFDKGYDIIEYLRLAIATAQHNDSVWAKSINFNAFQTVHHRSTPGTPLDLHHPAYDIPGQDNGYDCGVFTSKYLEYVAQDKPFDFSQNEILNFRRHIGQAILTGQISEQISGTAHNPIEIN